MCTKVSSETNLTLGAPVLLPLPTESLEPYDSLLPFRNITGELSVTVMFPLLSESPSSKMPRITITVSTDVSSV